MKNILVITGSPRNGGNSDLMADAFSEGAISRGHQVTKFAAAKKNIAACTACNQCWSKGRACVIDDDFSALAILIEAADVIVFASPLYWFTFSAQIKLAMDRLYAFDSANMPEPLKVKECVLLTCAADADVFDGIIKSYEYIAEYMKWVDRGVLTVSKVMEKGDILKTDALSQAKLLGEKI